MEIALKELRATLACANELEKVSAAAAAFAGKLGFVLYQLAWLRQPPHSQYFLERPNFIGNFPAEWLERYWRRHYHNEDCIARRCLISALPVAWDSSTAPTLNERQKRIACEAASYGLAAGAAVSVRMHQGLFVAFVLARFSNSCAEVPSQTLDTMALAGLAFAEAVAAAQNVQSAFDHPCILRGIEASCLLWSARGKTTREIGEILEIPERTVLFHISAAMDKLGAASRTQAAALAVKYGIIQP